MGELPYSGLWALYKVLSQLFFFLAGFDLEGKIIGMGASLNQRLIL